MITQFAKSGLQDVTVVFQRLQEELLQSGIGTYTSVEAQLRAVERDLRDLFIHPQRLSQALGAGGLTYEHAFIKRTERWSRPRLLQLLEEYSSARAVDETALFQAIDSFTPIIDAALGHITSIAHLEADKANLTVELLVKSCLRDMGDLIESSMFPFARLRLKILTIAKKLSPPRRTVEELTLGEVLSKLSELDGDLYASESLGVPLHQWRNIANHSSYRLFGDKVYCRYGKASHQKTLECHPEQLLEIAMYAQKVYYLHKVAYEVFCIDNLEQALSVRTVANHAIELRSITTDAALAYGIVSSGFWIEKAGRKDAKWAVVLTDRRNRTAGKIKSALQGAMISHVLQRGPSELYAWVNSRGKVRTISFRAEVGRREKFGLPEQAFTSRLLGANLRPRDTN